MIVKWLLAFAVVAAAMPGRADSSDVLAAPTQNTDPPPPICRLEVPPPQPPPRPDAIIPRYEGTIGMFGDGNHLGGIQAGGLGLDLELARRFGSNNVQLFAEGAVAALEVGLISSAQAGVQGRLGAGARWYPGTWGDSHSGVDVFVEAGGGETGYRWAGQSFARPDVSFGWGLQARAPRGAHTLAVRMSLRAMLAHDRAEPTFSCRGCTMSTPQTIDGGVLAVIGVAWW